MWFSSELSLIFKTVEDIKYYLEYNYTSPQIVFSISDHYCYDVGRDEEVLIHFYKYDVFSK